MEDGDKMTESTIAFGFLLDFAESRVCRIDAAA